MHKVTGGGEQSPPLFAKRKSAGLQKKSWFSAGCGCDFDVVTVILTYNATKHNEKQRILLWHRSRSGSINRDILTVSGRRTMSAGSFFRWLKKVKHWKRGRLIFRRQCKDVSIFRKRSWSSSNICWARRWRVWRDRRSVEMKPGTIILIVILALCACCLFTHRRVIKALLKHEPMPKAPSGTVG